MWKLELAQLATDTGLAITVCHHPPGTSKWNKSSTGCTPRSPATGEADL
jgi:Rhodopirellula transposase DDE domain